MRNLARNMAYLLKCKEISKEKIAKPEYETGVKTNFIR